MKNTKEILLVAGVSVGVGAAAFAAAKGIRYLMKKRKDEGIDECLEDYEKESWDIPDGVNMLEELPLDVADAGEPARNTVDYTKFSSKKRNESEEDEREHSSQKLISSEEFVNGTGNLMDSYVSVTGTYFVQDGVLAGWDASLDERDIESTVGQAAIDKLVSGEESAVYVVNEDLKVLYEIVKSNDPYGDALEELYVSETSDPAYSDED